MYCFSGTEIILVPLKIQTFKPNGTPYSCMGRCKSEIVWPTTKPASMDVCVSNISELSMLN